MERDGKMFGYERRGYITGAGTDERGFRVNASIGLWNYLI